MSPGVPHLGYTYLIRFARASSNLSDFNCRNKALTAKLLRQDYRYFKFREAFSRFDRRHSALVEEYSVSLKTLLQQGISEPEFYGDICLNLVLVCSCVFSVLLALQLPRLEKSMLILELFVRLFDLSLFGFIGFLFLLVSEKGCGL